MHARKALRRHLGVGAAVAALVTVGLVPQLAFASHYQASLEGSNFQIDDDANFVVDADPDATTDWNNVTETRQNDLPTGQNDDSYKGGVKEDTQCPDTTTGSIPNNKSDLKTFGVYEEPGDPGFLHLFWTRVSDPSGTTLMDFEFNQSSTGCPNSPNPQRTGDGNGPLTDDLLIEYSIDQGGARAALTVRKWGGSAWGPAVMLDQTDATGTINSTAIPAGQTGGVSDVDLQPRTFGEASIDLGLIFDPNKCVSFGSAMIKSRSSDSFTSQLKDFIAPVPISLTNCAKVVIHKETDPASTVLFDYEKSFNTDPATANTFQLADGGTKTFTNVLLGTGYTVEETLPLPSGWEFVDLDCSASVNVTPSINGRTVTFDLDDEDDVLECTYYNRARASLTFVKQVTDPPGGQAFGYTGSGGIGNFTLTPTGTGAAGADSETFGDLAPGTYGATETVPENWNLVSATCDNGDTPDAVTLAGGDNVTCTFVNTRERGAILITKTRKHAAAAGGTGPHAGVKFTVSGNGITPVEVTTDANGQACVPGLLDGDYTVTEENLANYAEEAPKNVSVTEEATCSTGTRATVSFVNTPLTDVTVSVDSLVDGGTSSTIDCVDASGSPVDSGSTGANGDGSLTIEDLLPTEPDGDDTTETPTLVCTIVVDP